VYRLDWSLQDRIQWRAAGNTEQNVRVSEKACSCFIGWMTSSCATRPVIKIISYALFAQKANIHPFVLCFI
jgi:hypothetical protein